MIRGISFLAKSTIDNDLFKVLKNIISSKFCNITFFEGLEDIDVFGVMQSENFLKTASNKKFYVYFLEMFVFKTKLQANTEKINNYEEFLNSNCELALFIYDNINVEIYCKNQAIIEEIKHNLNNSYSCIKYITDLNDVRTQFSVF